MQNVYYSAAKIGDKYYYVTFKVDVHKAPLNSYKDHKMTKIKIDPSLYEVSPDGLHLQTEAPIPVDTDPSSNGSSASKSSQTILEKESISNISIDVLTGKVKPSGIKDGLLHQATPDINMNKQKSRRWLRLRGLQLPPVVLPSTGSDNIISDEGNNFKTSYNQYAGKNSFKSKEVSDALGLAYTMVDEGKSEKEILKETGWFRGMDGKWRYEIPDHTSWIDFSALDYALDYKSPVQFKMEQGF